MEMTISKRFGDLRVGNKTFKMFIAKNPQTTTIDDVDRAIADQGFINPDQKACAAFINFLHSSRIILDNIICVAGAKKTDDGLTRVPLISTPIKRDHANTKILTVSQEMHWTGFYIKPEVAFLVLKQ